MIPVVTMPSTKYFCAQKKTINSGMMVTAVAAMSNSHSMVYSSLYNESASCTVRISSVMVMISGHVYSFQVCVALRATREAITGALGNSDLVQVQLRNLVDQGVAREVMKDGRGVYLFDDFQVKLAIKQCPYCGNDYPVRDDIENCPTCGGDLKMHRGAIADAGQKYSMDDDDDTDLS